MAARLRWVDGGQAPTPAGIAGDCAARVAAFGDGCRFLPDDQPQPLTHRVAARLRP